MNKVFHTCFLLLVVTLANTARAEQPHLQASCAMDFPEAMLHLQDSIGHYGYTISRVQHVDKGLTERGYQSLPYKVVFFGKPEEIDMIRNDYPMLIPFIPMSITLSEDGNSTLASAIRPTQLSQVVDDFKAQIFFRRWEQHMSQILERFHACRLDA